MNASVCYLKKTKEENIACMCASCNFARAIEICRSKEQYIACEACRKGRSQNDWLSTGCPVGVALTANRNIIKGRVGVKEERWRGYVREEAYDRAVARLLLSLPIPLLWGKQFCGRVSWTGGWGRGALRERLSGGCYEHLCIDSSSLTWMKMKPSRVVSIACTCAP